MKKPKKITVKFFINTHLQPIEIDGEICRPLYAQITYNRKNTQIKCFYGWYYKDYEQVVSTESELLSFEESIFKKSVAYELSKLGENFGLKGLGKKYEIYCTSIHSIFNTYLKLRLKNIISSAKPSKFLEVLHLDNSDLSFFILYEAAQKLFYNLSEIMTEDFLAEIEMYRIYYQFYQEVLDNNQYGFPVVIDWLNGSHPDFLENKLKNVYSKTPEKIETFMKTIHKIVRTRVEMS